MRGCVKGFRMKEVDTISADRRWHEWPEFACSGHMDGHIVTCVQFPPAFVMDSLNGLLSGSFVWGDECR